MGHPSKPANVPYAKFGEPQTLNLYAYLRNNPLNEVDPDGHGGDPCNVKGYHLQCLPGIRQISIIQIKQTVNLYEDNKDPNKITGTVEVTTNIVAIYGGGLPTSVSASAVAQNVGDTNYSPSRLSTIGDTVAAIQAQGAVSSLGADPSRLLTSLAAKESTLGLTNPTNPLSLVKGRSRTDRYGNINGAIGVAQYAGKPSKFTPDPTYRRYCGCDSIDVKTQKFVNTYRSMEESISSFSPDNP